jgi:hypothetical protein
LLHDFETRLTAGVTGQQGMLTPPRHLILPLHLLELILYLLFDYDYVWHIVNLSYFMYSESVTASDYFLCYHKRCHGYDSDDWIGGRDLEDDIVVYCEMPWWFQNIYLIRLLHIKSTLDGLMILEPSLGLGATISYSMRPFRP